MNTSERVSFKSSRWFLLSLLIACHSGESQAGKPVQDSKSPQATGAPIVSKEKKVEEAKFSGKISDVNFGVPYDADNTITVDGRVISFASGGRQLSSDTEEGPWGKMIGFDLPSDHTGKYDELNGKTAEVFCRVDYATGPKGEAVPIYTLYGDANYFVKLKKKFLGIF